MNELWNALPFWVAAPFLAAAAMGNLRARRLTAALLGACVLASWVGGGGSAAAWSAAHLLLAFWVPRVWDRKVREAEGRFTRESTVLRDRCAVAARAHAELGESHEALSAQLDRAQNRAGLVQVMATKLEGRDILQTLGHMWKAHPSVRGCLLLWRHPNGNWTASFADRIFNADEWVAYIASHHAAVSTRRVRRFPPGARPPSFPGRNEDSAYVMIPFVWDKDLLAAACLELAPSCPEEAYEDFNVERRLAAIGLRRAYLYDLMTERSRHDGLTGAFLRRFFLERLEEAIRKAERYKSGLFFALVDVDHFKSVNDRWGHLVGDKVLVGVAEAVRRLAPPGVTLGRYGGDEFALIMELDALREAVQWLDTLRRSMEKTVFRETNVEASCTLSIGVSAYWPERPSRSELVNWADKALYRAKELGRNQVVARGWDVTRPA